METETHLVQIKVFFSRGQSIFFLAIFRQSRQHLIEDMIVSLVLSLWE